MAAIDPSIYNPRRGLFDAEALVGPCRLDQARRMFQDAADRTAVGAAAVF